MRLLGAFLLLASFLSAGNKAIVTKLWEAGKPYDLSKTLVAIGSIESNFGSVKINLSDPSCGITHIHLRYFMIKYGIEDTPLNRNRVCQRLIDNDDLAIAESVFVLVKAKDRFCTKYGCTKEQWLKVWGFYNAGNNYNSPRGQAYAKKVKKRIREIEAALKD